MGRGTAGKFTADLICKIQVGPSYLSWFIPHAKSHSIGHYIGCIRHYLTDPSRTHQPNQPRSRLTRPIGSHPSHSRWKPELGSNGHPKASGMRYQFNSNSILNKSPACQTLYLIVWVMQSFEATCWLPKTNTQNNTWTILSTLVQHQLYSMYFSRELLSSETLCWPKTWWCNMNTLWWCNQRGQDLDESWWQILML